FNRRCLLHSLYLVLIPFALHQNSLQDLSTAPRNTMAADRRPKLKPRLNHKQKSKPAPKPTAGTDEPDIKPTTSQDQDSTEPSLKPAHVPIPNKIVLVTGAKKGVGYEVAKMLLKDWPNCHIILGSRELANEKETARKLQAEKDVKGTVSAIELDGANINSVDAAVEKVAADHGRLDILVNIPAAVSQTSLPSKPEYRKMINENLADTLTVTETFLDLLRKSTERRLVFVPSSVGSVSQISGYCLMRYSAHKFEEDLSRDALNMLIKTYWNRLRDERFKVLGADPGTLGTRCVGTDQAMLDCGAAIAAAGGELIAKVVKGEMDDAIGSVVTDPRDMSSWY
ncbi:unnamed protein product, partial [Penicillium salamii]